MAQKKTTKGGIMAIGKKKQPKIPKGYEGGETIYELITKQTFYPKPKPFKITKKDKAFKPKPMKVEVVNVVKTKPKGKKK